MPCRAVPSGEPCRAVLSREPVSQTAGQAEGSARGWSSQLPAALLCVCVGGGAAACRALRSGRRVTQ